MPNAIADLCGDVGTPSGLATYGYGEADVDPIVEGALRQQRLLAVSPRPAVAEDLALIVRESMEP